MPIGRTNAGGASLGFWRFMLATALPSVVTRSCFVAVVANVNAQVYTTEAQPTTPSAGDVWFHVAQSADNVLHSTGDVPFICWGVYKYSGSAWESINAYYAFLGTWKQVTGLPPAGTALANCSWDQINRICAAGKAADYFCVGDEKDITLSTAENVTLQIIGLGHDDLSAAGGGKAPITFGFKNCMATRQKMNATSTSAGGYSGCALYQTINGAIYGSLPADLRAVMKNVGKLSYAGGESTTLVTTQEKLFMLSKVEVIGSGGADGTQYAFFTNGGSRVKTVGGTAASWWTRSTFGTGYWVYVKSDGGTSGGDGSAANGLVLALCV